MQKRIAILIIVGLLASIGCATMFGVFVPTQDPNTAEMSYGGTLTLSLVSSVTTQRIDAQDPNIIVQTTVVRIRMQ